MDEHLWTSSFWRLLSNCSDSRKLLIVQKIILHKLGHTSDFSRSLNKNSINKSLQLPNDTQDIQTINPITNEELSVNKNKSNEKSLIVSHLNVNHKQSNTAKRRRVAPVMGTNALLAKYKNCVQSEESKIIETLVNTKFNKKYNNEVNVSKVIIDNMENKHTTDFEILSNIPDMVADDIRLSFDERKFLEEALGDDALSFISSDSEYVEHKDEDTTATTPRQQSISVTSSRISSLISRATSTLSSLKKRIRRGSNKRQTVPTPSMQSPVIHTEVDILLQEASIQHQIIIEASKAINVCLSSKEFIDGPEHIEAERILLLAKYKQNTILQEMKQLRYFAEKSDISKGYADISQLKLPVSTTTQQKEGYVNWFVAIVSCDGHVFVTNTVDVNCSNVIEFPDEFKFKNLQHDFKIEVSIYSLLAKTNEKDVTRDSKESVICLRTPNKLLCRRNSIKRSIEYYFKHCEPSFKLCGKTSIGISDTDRVTPFKLLNVPTGTILTGYAIIKFNTRVEFVQNHSGFLTLRTEWDNCLSWNHRWCNLIGHTLYYWNYPADQDLVEPIGKINLQQCITSEISVVDRNLCARPRTLLVETAEPSEQGTLFLRHFLSADSTEKMIFWQDRLNEVLQELIKWNLKCKVQLI